MSRVYVSLPLTGPQGRGGRDVLRGAELALEGRWLELVVLDSSQSPASANAHTAADDPAAVAYLGDFSSAEVLESAPILGEAELLAVAPVATFAGLGGPTLVRLSPDDRAGARAIADWLGGAGVAELLIAHDHDPGYGVPVGQMCAEAARERGLAVRCRPVWDTCAEAAAELGEAGAVLYVGVAGSGAADLWHGLHAANPALWLLGSEGVAQEWFARELSAGAAQRTRFFVAQRAPLGFYGYEAMQLICDAFDAAPEQGRAAVAASARAASDRDSVIGRYSLDADGLTTSPTYGRLAVAGGELVWDRG